MKALMQSPYITFMAARPLLFGKKTYQPGEKVPQRLLDPMRDPEVLIRTGRVVAVAKDMNKVPAYLRKDVEDETLARTRILRTLTQLGPVEQSDEDLAKLVAAAAKKDRYADSRTTYVTVDNPEGKAPKSSSEDLSDDETMDVEDDQEDDNA